MPLSGLGKRRERIRLENLVRAELATPPVFPGEPWGRTNRCGSAASHPPLHGKPSVFRASSSLSASCLVRGNSRGTRAAWRISLISCGLSCAAGSGLSGLTPSRTRLTASLGSACRTHGRAHRAGRWSRGSCLTGPRWGCSSRSSLLLSYQLAPCPLHSSGVGGAGSDVGAANISDQW